MYYTMLTTRWGRFGLVARDGAVLATYMLYPDARMRKMIRADWPEAVENKNLLPALQAEITAYFAGKVVSFEGPINLQRVPPFRRRVLEACAKIPYGQTCSYGDLAIAAGSPRASRAVGGAMAHNPIPLIIPCHRVLRSDGSLGGFSSPKGTDLKQRMLDLELANKAEPNLFSRHDAVTAVLARA
ncbi:MAG: methylated-DNA--[protein]-cysteine S-methyltransferase [Planctomycetota bacterium]|jgi:methylated-DNA-[protein]-cysteine S-methyltransferase